MEPTAPAPAHPPAFQRFLREWVLGAALPIWLVTTFGATLATVDGNSMNPTLHSGDRLALLKYPRWLCAWGARAECPQRGQIVVFKGPPDSPYSHEPGLFGLTYRPYLIKRVVAVEGDTVAASGGRLVVNGRAVTERYASGADLSDFAPVTVPKGRLFVLGDNRVVGESVDSRYFGSVSLRDVAGPVGPRLWPPGARRGE